MEKLIELLNEREKTVNWVQHPWRCKEHLEYQCHWPRVINKRFWFIKWLFDKDKIDWSKFHKYSFYKKDNKFIQYYDYESLLIALSISDTPIEDLILYLK